MDHFECRKFQSISRHLILSCVSHLFPAEFHQKHRGKHPDLTICQVRTATAKLAPLWAQGGLCARKQAEKIAAQLALTQHRNAKAARRHRKQILRQLHTISVTLNNTRKCQRPRK